MKAYSQRLHTVFVSAALIALVLDPTARADQPLARRPATTTTPVSPINSLMDTDMLTCKARGGIPGRNHDKSAVCIHAKQTPDAYRQAHGLPPAQSPAA